MDGIQLVILALIQGLTEFLPVSSSAHLILPSQLLGWPDQGLGFDVAVHLGTLFAVIGYFHQDIRVMAVSWLKSFAGERSDNARLAWWVIIATLPAVVSGFLFASMIDLYARSILIIASATLFFGALMWWVDERQTETRTLRDLSWRQGLVIGFAQALALIPGTSRSGITITTALWLGFERQAAARFSFLLSIPVIAGAALYKTIELSQQTTAVAWALLGQGVLVSALSAIVCIHVFLKILNTVGMKPFVIYRLILGAGLMIFYFKGL